MATLDDPERTGGRPPARRTMLTSAVVAGFVVTLARWAFSADRRSFHVSPDEPSQLAIARWLAGGRRWNMFDHATWQPGLGTLLTPIYWFTDDGESAVRWALGVNALIAGISAALLVVLVRRLTELSAPVCAVIAVIVAAAPSSLSASSFVWAEPLVSLTFVAAVLALMHWFEAGRLSTGALAIALSVAGYSSHSRLLPFVGTTVALTVGWEAWHRRWPRFCVLGTLSGILLILSAAWTRWILANVWESPNDQNTVGAVWERARQPLDIADAALGQLWYQLAATLGVALIGAVVIGAAMTGRHLAIEPDGKPTAIDARILVVSTVPLLVLSAVFMADRGRPDQFIYGRYNDAVMWPVIALGAAWWVQRMRNGFTRSDRVLVTATIAGIISTGLAVDVLHGDEIRERYGVRGMIAGVLSFVDGNDSLHVWRTSLIAAGLSALIAAFVAVGRLRPLTSVGRRSVFAIGSALGLGIMGVAVVRTERVADLKLNGWTPAAEVRAVDEIVPPGMPLAVRPVPSAHDPVVSWVPQRQRYQLYQLYLPERTFLRDRGVDDDIGPYVFAPLRDPDLIDAGARLIWKDPAIQIGLWEERTVD